MIPKNVLGMSTHPALKWDVTNELLPEPEVTYIDFDLFLSFVDHPERFRFIQWELIPFKFSFDVPTDAFDDWEVEE